MPQEIPTVDSSGNQQTPPPGPGFFATHPYVVFFLVGIAMLAIGYVLFIRKSPTTSTATSGTAATQAGVDYIPTTNTFQNEGITQGTGNTADVTSQTGAPVQQNVPQLPLAPTVPAVPSGTVGGPSGDPVTMPWLEDQGGPSLPVPVGQAPHIGATV
jgi:hypothetical protein